ncbi:MAG: HAMP domain-containing sensor histidine kinase [Proteobacteria bacterium]|nr:HAMP domain-containing sensor histidine kinase [Pseudomonadota bacterium]
MTRRGPCTLRKTRARRHGTGRTARADWFHPACHGQVPESWSRIRPTSSISPHLGQACLMSIRLRFTLALTAVGGVLFGTYALWAYRSERDDLRTAATREIRIIGRALEASLGHALRDQQGADIEATLAMLDRLDPNVDIHTYDPRGVAIARSQGATSDAIVDGFVARAGSTRRELVAFDPVDDPDRLVFAAPLLADDGVLLGTVAISRPVTDLDDDLARTRDRLIGMVVAFLLATMCAGLVLGTVHVSRPIARLVAGVRQIRQGDFRARVEPGRRDEIGELVGEFNAMIQVLASETEARERLEHGLQRIDKLVTIGQLSAGLAHEIGSPLQVLAGRASGLRTHADPEVRRQADQLVGQCDRITRIVEQLLSFGRRKAAVVAACDLVEPVRAVIDLLGGEARRRGITLALVVDGDARRLRIDGDRDQLQQVALNLVKNALAATPPKGRITVRLDRDGDRVRLSVADSGTGIDPETRARLFEPFFTTRATDGGTGLGLAVVRAIVDEHHARIEVASQVGAGAEFVVSFPEVSHG